MNSSWYAEHHTGVLCDDAMFKDVDYRVKRKASIGKVKGADKENSNGQVTRTCTMDDVISLRVV